MRYDTWHNAVELCNLHRIYICGAHLSVSSFVPPVRFAIVPRQMCPSFGVPWTRLERAAARLTHIHSGASLPRVQPLLFLCGLKYLSTYRAINRRRLTHYVDDGLREAVERGLPALVQLAKELELDAPVHRLSKLMVNTEWERITYAFLFFNDRLPADIARWASGPVREASLVRLTFGMGVMARFAPESHTLVRRLVEKPVRLSAEEFDVLESFRWDSRWSVALGA
jgi:hypothetical protein